VLVYIEIDVFEGLSQRYGNFRVNHEIAMYWNQLCILGTVDMCM